MAPKRKKKPPAKRRPKKATTLVVRDSDLLVPMKLVPSTVEAREAPEPDRSWEVLACIFRALVFVTTLLLTHAH